MLKRHVCVAQYSLQTPYLQEKKPKTKQKRQELKSWGEKK